jgi:hypothetical protein
MVNKFLKYFFAFAFLILTAIGVSAQSDASTANGRAPEKEDIPKNIKESLVKHRIEKEKKDHDEMIERGEEALKLSEELEKSVRETNRLTAQDQAKLSRIEKIVKKIRSELGGDDDGDALPVDNAENKELIEKPSALTTAVKQLQSTASKLLDELKKTTRFSVSVVAIQSSNSVLNVLKFIRFTK